MRPGRRKQILDDDYIIILAMSITVLYACVNACICIYMRACVRAYVRTCMCECVRACVHACMRACSVWACG